MNHSLLEWIGDEAVLHHFVAGLPTFVLLVVIALCVVVLSKGADWMIDGVVDLARLRVGSNGRERHRTIDARVDAAGFVVVPEKGRRWFQRADCCNRAASEASQRELLLFLKASRSSLDEIMSINRRRPRHALL